MSDEIAPIDDTFLEDVGLGKLPEELKESMRQHIKDTLEERVGAALAARMSESQLDEFEKFMDDDDYDGARAWLGAKFPYYRKLARSKFEDLKIEIRGIAKDILKHEGIEDVGSVQVGQ